MYNIEELVSRGAKIKAYDPEAMENVKGVIGDKIEFAKDEYDAAEGADALLIMTEWPVFRTPEFKKLETLLKEKVIFDGRNLYELDNISSLGFKYYSIGREVV